MARVSQNEATFTTGHGCTSTDTLYNQSTTNVYIEGVRVLLNGSKIADPHTYNPPDCDESHDITYTGGSPTVFANGIKIGRVGDPVDQGSITTGATTVFCA